MKNKNKDTHIADLYESTSKYGNKYFYGRYESGTKILLKRAKGKKTEKGEQVWQLFMGE